MANCVSNINHSFVTSLYKLKGYRCNSCAVCLVVLSCPTLFDPMNCIAHHAPLSMGFSKQAYWSGLPCPPLGDLPNPGIEPRSAALQVDSLPSEPPGKPKNTGVGSISLPQGIFLTQGSNWGLLHCAGRFFTSWITITAMGPIYRNNCCCFNSSFLTHLLQLITWQL